MFTVGIRLGGAVIIGRITVKICGVTNLPDALAAVEAGADALGFVCYRNSPRFVATEAIRQIVSDLPPFVMSVGVFVNEDMITVREVMDRCGLALAQFHGEEDATYCKVLGRPILKAIRLRTRSDCLALAEFKKCAQVRGFLVDAFSEGIYGGTGQTADWELAAEVARVWRVILAGGLTSDNVKEAVQRVRPYGVDVSSGVEASPGKKDCEKVRAFIEAAKLA